MRRDVLRFILMLSLLALVLVQPVFAGHEWMCNATTPYHWPNTNVTIVPATEENPAGAIGRPEADYHVAYDNAVLLWNSTVMNLSYSTNGDLSLFYDTYGFNGWLGLATITFSNCVIQSATSQLNDTYLNNDPQLAVDHVACQEIGHTFGLDHNRGSNTTCMNDNILTAGNQINQHDRDALFCIYNVCNQPPSAFFSWNNPYSVRVDFDASGSSDSDGTIVSYRWDFGDGTITTTTTPTTSHWYPAQEMYFAQLTVTDDGGETAVYFDAIDLCPNGEFECLE